MGNEYAEIIIPFAIPGSYTYLIPPELSGKVHRGSLVSVPFGQSLNSAGLVIMTHSNPPSDFTPRSLTNLFPDEISINDHLIDFILWVSDYYLAFPGEVLKAAIPSADVLAGMASGGRRRKKPGITIDLISPMRLNELQSAAFDKIQDLFHTHEVVLLHGVTSSGKTEIYIHLINEQLARGRQVLYLLPEISLTTQIIERLRRHFGDAIGTYHSRLTPAARSDIWKRVSDGSLQVILGARSSLFLPFSDLGLIIVDEEHDSSYKQYDPAPRYHARDAAMMLSRIHGGVTLLGSATPSLESWHNAITGRYGHVELMTRFGEVMMPEMIIADTRYSRKGKMASPHFTPVLLDAIDQALARREQVILFQNRRGFSAFIMCPVCGWVPRCTDCSVSYTYHKSIGRMVCHYCSRKETVPDNCPSCGSETLTTKGFGTEKIEEEISLLFPSAKVARMDQDTTRRRNAASKILSDFAKGETDILIGTQMISKGLDFEKLTVVGIIDADNMLHFPDFRAFERSYQMIEQVSGRAGRRTQRGKVIIQTADPSHIVLRKVLNHDYRAFYHSQLEERQLFGYPPFMKIIKIIVRHRDQEELNRSSARLADNLRKHLGRYVLGPEYPAVMQVQRMYIKNILVKLGKELSASKVKEVIRKAMDEEVRVQRKGPIRIHADVDPQ